MGVFWVHIKEIPILWHRAHVYTTMPKKPREITVYKHIKFGAIDSSQRLPREDA